MNFSIVKWWYLIFLLNIFQFSLTYADTVNTKLSNDHIALGESFTVTFSLNNTSNVTQPDLSPLERDFYILGTNYGSSFNLFNGVAQRQSFWQVALEAKREGELWIPEINFGGTHSNAVKLFVGEAIQKNNSSATPATFVKAEIDTSDAYVDSQLIYKFKLYYHSQLINPMLEPISIENSSFLPIEQDKHYQENINGTDYLVYEKSFAIFPHKAGQLMIPAMRFQAVELEENPNNFLDQFAIGNQKRLTLTTQAFTVNIKPIPPNFKSNLWLPAKSIQLNEDWSADLSQLKAGTPIVRTITIKAKGLQAEQIPDLKLDKITGLNSYTERPHRTNSFEEDSIVGTWQQKITYIPNQAATFTLPGLNLSWWNTKTNAEENAQLKSMTMNVQADMNKVNIAPPAIDSNPNENHIAPARLQNVIAANQNISPWFWIAMLLLSAWLLTLVWIWKKNNLKSNIEIPPSPKVMSNPVKPYTANESEFQKACQQNNPVLAQKYLLEWSKEVIGAEVNSLGQLSGLLQDKNFKMCLQGLEKALYQKNSDWNGETLLLAYFDMKKNYKNNRMAHKSILKDTDPLPPLFTNYK